MEKVKQFIESLEKCNDMDSLHKSRNSFFNDSCSMILPYLQDVVNYAIGKKTFELFTGTTELRALVGEVKNNNQYIMLTRKNLGGLILRKEDIQYVFCNAETSTIRSIHGEFEVLEVTEDFIKLFNN